MPYTDKKTGVTKYTSLEKANFYANLASTGKSSKGEKLTNAQKAACIVKAAKFQERATRNAKTAARIKNNPNF
ncbi:MAG: hypothetical protein FWD49_07175 [Firmicutes bacterium]|nr:hypothetical protein [Bacillota bacterium]